MNKRTSILVQPQPLGKNTLNEIQIASLDANYDESAAITSISVTSTQIDLKIGDKINIAGQSLEINADASAGDRNLTIVSITLTAPITIGNEIRINEENLFEQYQRKTEGTVAGFDIDADGISKGGVEITGWLDSDTMTGATANNVPTAESVKAYVDASSGGTTPTLQEVLAVGNTTSGNDMIFTDSDELKIGTGSDLKLYHNGSDSYIKNYTGTLYIDNEASGKSLIFKTVATERMRITQVGLVGIGTSSPQGVLHIDRGGSSATTYIQGNLAYTDWLRSSYSVGSMGLRVGVDSSNKHIIRTLSTKSLILGTNNSDALTIDRYGKVGIGTTAPSEKLQISSPLATHAKILIDAGADADLILDKGAGSRRSSVNYKIAGVSKWYAGTADSDVVGSGDDYYIGTTVGGTNAQFFIKRSNGNTGIGTILPEEPLHVGGDTKIDGGLKVTAANIDFTGLATTDPILQGRLWNDGGTLKISSG